MKRVFLSLMAIAFWGMHLVASAAADERILHMDVSATVRADASMTVYECLTVRAEGDRIERGIIREIPVSYTGKNGVRYRTDFELLAVSVDNRPVPLVLENVGTRVKVRLGEAERRLAEGEHTLEMAYRTRGWVAFRGEFDELYWNVTGNDWVFPIDRATMRVSLPGDGRVRRIEAFTGARGDTGQDFQVLRDDEASGGSRVETTRTLQPGEGLTVAYAWDKGLVPRPERRAGETIRSVAAMLSVPVCILSLLLVSGYYTATWWRVGRARKKGTIIPLFHPPEGVEPGFAAYFRDKRRRGDDILAADILQLAVKGCLSFAEEGGKLSMLPTDKIGGQGGANALQALSPALRRLAEILFFGASFGALGDYLLKRIGLEVSDGWRFDQAKRALTEIYAKKREAYTERNAAAVERGIFCFVPLLVLLYARGPLADLGIWELLPIWVYSAAAGAAIFAIGVWAYAGSRAVGPDKKCKEGETKKGQKKTRKRWILGTTIAFLAGFFMQEGFDLVIFLTTLFCAAVANFFSRRMSRLSEAGTELARQIEGLAMYMETAERGRLEHLNPPAETPELFERLLPYAFALGCAETWANRFAEILRDAGYQPAWDRSGSLFSDGRYDAAATIGSDVAQTIASSVADYREDMGRSTGSSSSYEGDSGFDGGSSGGGGGGGGGRGF